MVTFGTYAEVRWNLIEYSNADNIIEQLSIFFRFTSYRPTSHPNTFSSAVTIDLLTRNYVDTALSLDHHDVLVTCCNQSNQSYFICQNEQLHTIGTHVAGYQKSCRAHQAGHCNNEYCANLSRNTHTRTRKKRKTAESYKKAKEKPTSSSSFTIATLSKSRQ